MTISQLLKDLRVFLDKKEEKEQELGRIANFR